MKLIITVVQDEDSQKLISTLMNEGFGVTSWQLPAVFESGKYHLAYWC